MWKRNLVTLAVSCLLFTQGGPASADEPDTGSNEAAGATLSALGAIGGAVLLGSNAGYPRMGTGMYTVAQIGLLGLSGAGIAIACGGTEQVEAGCGLAIGLGSAQGIMAVVGIITTAAYNAGASETAYLPAIHVSEDAIVIPNLWQTRF